MRSGYIAVIGGIVTFVGVLTVATWKSGEPVTAQVAQTPVAVESVVAASGSPVPSSRVGAASVVAQRADEPAPVAEPPEDARAMMDAALASPDADVRDEASALSQAMNSESTPPGE